MQTVTAAEMREIDRKATDVYGVPSLLLMEYAGRGVAEIAFSSPGWRSAVVVCGPGNNGGDGFVAARHLFNGGWQVSVVLAGEPPAAKTDAGINYAILQKMHTPILPASRQAFDQFKKSHLIIDALFGVGLNKPLEGLFADCVKAMNDSARSVIAIDVPSGLDSDTGAVLGVAVRATITGTLGLAKKGLFAGSGPELAGEIRVIDIGLPRDLPHP